MKEGSLTGDPLYTWGMGFGDRFRKKGPAKRGNELKQLAAWAEGRKGLEGYIEPQTATNPTTLLLVDRDGEFKRGAVNDPSEAGRFCNRNGIPVYDAAIMGYPDRMKGRPRREEAEIKGDIDAAVAELEKMLEQTPDEGDR